jgi:hypothetical protein
MGEDAKASNQRAGHKVKPWFRFVRFIELNNGCPTRVELHG